eukprot:TRINITY_DN5555_c0_g1_i1.p1 TRINITY_DN5555_c0_g1~~TRINITY_DN5555_c0_g1_i1.p1  ORF type:complete len:293 (-),score=62.58 TRINITY_DN5555_c0_g1_i1:205-1083(-)
MEHGTQGHPRPRLHGESRSYEVLPSRCQGCRSFVHRHAVTLLVTGLLTAVVVVLGILVSAHRDEIIRTLSNLRVDRKDPGASTLFILAGVGLVVTQFVGLSWWLFPTAYFFGYIAFLYHFLVCVVGISINFWGGRMVKQCVARRGWAESSARQINTLQRHFESRPVKFVSLVCFSPISIGLCISLLGMYTEIHFLVVLSVGTASMMIQALPIVLIAASAASLVDAFDAPANIASTILTLVGAVLMCVGLGWYTKHALREVEMLEAAEAEEECSNPATKADETSSLLPGCDAA